MNHSSNTKYDNSNIKKRKKIKLSRKKKFKIYKIDISPNIKTKSKRFSVLKTLFNNQNINIIQNVINPQYLQVVEKIPNFPLLQKDHFYLSNQINKINLKNKSQLNIKSMSISKKKNKKKIFIFQNQKQMEN